MLIPDKVLIVILILFLISAIISDMDMLPDKTTPTEEELSVWLCPMCDAENNDNMTDEYFQCLGCYEVFRWDEVVWLNTGVKL
jgi:hypothetical protein